MAGIFLGKTAGCTYGEDRRAGILPFCISPAADAAPKMVICQAGSVEVNTRTEKWCDTADEILEYMVGGDRLRDVITQVKVWERTI